MACNPSRQVSLESLIATCSRDIYINRKSWERLYERLQHLKGIDQITNEDILSIVYLDTLNDVFEDYKSDRELDAHIQDKLEKSKDTRDRLLKDLHEKNEKLDKINNVMIEDKYKFERHTRTRI